MRASGRLLSRALATRTSLSGLLSNLCQKSRAMNAALLPRPHLSSRTRGIYGALGRGLALFGASNGPSGGPTPVTFVSDPDKLAALKAELQEKLLQIEGLEGRARQDSNLRPSDS